MRIYSSFVVLTAVIACGAIGCGPDIQAVCEESEKCRDGNEADVGACVALGEYEEDIADLHGCSSEFSDYFDCFQAEASCDSANNDYGLTDNTACEAESNAYQRCQ